MCLVAISGLHDHIRVRLVDSRVLRFLVILLMVLLLSWRHLVVNLTNLHSHSILRKILTGWHRSRLTWLRLNIVISRLHIDSLVIDHVTTATIQREQS